MILCKYLGSDGCVDIIKNQRLLAADPTNLNDPFEIKPGVIGTPDKVKTLRYFYNELLPERYSDTKVALPIFNDDAALKKIEQDLKPAIIEQIEKNLIWASKTLRIICFCNPIKIKDGDDVLLWSHYSDKHKGMRIFFETDEIKTLSNNLFPVDYSFERPNFDITDPASKIKIEDARRIIKTKNKSWEYEQEVRWIISLQECIQKDGRSYIPLSPKAIRRIDFGCKCESEKVIPLLKDDDNAYQHVKLYKALVHERRYSLKYKEINNK
ncbi:MAG: DUF2971 domain-containing protein [Phycisphaerae bacterium]|nr:DUF2971 domain-containing protein [Phycisphaerae bacterium]